MPKQKTIKSISKRFRLKKSGKVIKRKDNQNHFNAKDTGKKTRLKRRPLTLSKSDANLIRKLMR